MAWKPGQSGNPHGRPRTGNTLVERLEAELDKKRGSRKKIDIICETFTSLAIGGDVQAIKKIFDIVQRDFEFFKTCEIEDRIKALEERLKTL